MNFVVKALKNLKNDINNSLNFKKKSNNNFKITNNIFVISDIAHYKL